MIHELPISDATENTQEKVRDLLTFVVNEEPVELVVMYRKTDGKIYTAQSDGVDKITMIGSLHALAYDTWEA